MDDDDNPLPSGAPVVLTPLRIAPGNTALSFGEGGDQDAVEFTVYFGLTTRRADTNTVVATTDVVADNYGIRVRGRNCLARVRVWHSPRSGRGGVEVLCRSVTGKAV
ncbi:head-to-tail stopper [Mycobacterium phage IdentityCrisis]|uniref:Head-to-tail stopper n=1 Tax=Mycobacterium phage IdentityCrisis TaxID=2599866 RepID=A0A5J6TJW0_9CAUD|nr:head-to-tail stopper [Mycobacterium phage IdentityCrisis]QFG10029.1 head-to-tail stopper [Mycobacterium phage IdentityCrisis]